MKPSHIQAQREALLQRIAAQRTELAKASSVLRPPLAIIDTSCELVRSSKLRPYYLISAAALSVCVLRKYQPAARKSLTAISLFFSVRRFIARNSGPRTANKNTRS